MTITKPWLIGVAVVVLLVAVLSGFLWLQEHDARLKSDTVQSAQDQIIKTNQAVIDSAKAAQEQTANDLKAQITAISAQRIVVVTPQQAAAVANALPGLAQPVQVQTVAAVPATPTTPAQPATQQIVIPAADIPAFQKYKLDCDESNAKLTACSLNAASATVIQQSTDDKLKAMTTERDSWKATAKGGTIMQRLGKAGKCIGLSGIGAGIGAWADGKKPARGAVIGAGAGTVGCTLWGW